MNVSLGIEKKDNMKNHMEKMKKRRVIQTTTCDKMTTYEKNQW